MLFFQVNNRQFFQDSTLQNRKLMFFFQSKNSKLFGRILTIKFSLEVYFDLSMLLQSFARSDLATFVHDAVYMDLLLLLRNVARLDVPPAILNACRIGVFLMVLGAVKLGSIPFLQSFAYVGSALLVSSHMDLDFSLFLQGLS